MAYKQYDLKSVILRILPIEMLFESTECYIPLFHGTDRRLLNLSSEQRQELKDACVSFINYAFPILKDHGVSKMRMNDKAGLFGENQMRVIDAYIGASGMISGCKWFEYESSYLTANPGKAMSYARRSYLYGELGYIADSFQIALNSIGWDYANLTPEQYNSYHLIKAATEEICPDPVVLLYLGIPKDQIADESGRPVDWEHRIKSFLMDVNEGSFRVSQPFDISSGKIINIDDLPIVQ